MNVARWIAAGLLAVTLPVALPALARGVDVGVSVQINQPGVYGRIEIGRYPQPQVVNVYPRAVVIRAAPVYVVAPPGHRKHWRQHCGAYGACATPVVFVHQGWHAHPGKSGHKRHDFDDDRGHGKQHGKGHRDRDRD